MRNKFGSQNGFTNNSGIFCRGIFNHEFLREKDLDIAYGKIMVITKKNDSTRTEYIIEYDIDDHEDKDIASLTTNVPNRKEMKLFLKLKFVRADAFGHRFGRTKKKTRSTKKKDITKALFVQKKYNNI